jgi:hypothetical protein
VIYFLVFAILIAMALLPAIVKSNVWPDGPHDGAGV